MDVQWIREQIPACQRMVYLNTGWDGPSPKSVVQAVKDRVEYESYNGPTSPPVYQSGREIQQKAREGAADLLNVSPQEIVLTQSTTDGLNLVLNGLDWAEGGRSYNLRPGAQLRAHPGLYASQPPRRPPESSRPQPHRYPRGDPEPGCRGHLPPDAPPVLQPHPVHLRPSHARGGAEEAHQRRGRADAHRRRPRLLATSPLTCGSWTATSIPYPARSGSSDPTAPGLCTSGRT